MMGLQATSTKRKYDQTGECFFVFSLHLWLLRPYENELLTYFYLFVFGCRPRRCRWSSEDDGKCMQRRTRSTRTTKQSMYTSKDKSMVHIALGIDERAVVAGLNGGHHNITFGHFEYSKCRREHSQARSGRNGIAIHGDAIEQQHEWRRRRRQWHRWQLNLAWFGQHKVHVGHNTVECRSRGRRWLWRRWFWRGRQYYTVLFTVAVSMYNEYVKEWRVYDGRRWRQQWRRWLWKAQLLLRTISTAKLLTNTVQWITIRQSAASNESTRVWMVAAQSTPSELLWAGAGCRQRTANHSMRWKWQIVPGIRQQQLYERRWQAPEAVLWRSQRHVVQ